MPSNIALTFPQEGYEVLISLFSSIGEGISVQELCNRAIGIVQGITGFETIVIRVYDPDQGCNHLTAYTGMNAQVVKEVECCLLDAGLSSEALKKLRPVFTTDIQSNPKIVNPIIFNTGFKSLACIPLLAGEQVMGTLELLSKDVIEWEEDELQWLALSGRIIGCSIHQVQQRDHLNSMAILEERSRLAQEIHDGLIQMLSALNFWVEESEEALEQNNLPRLRLAMEKRGAIARDLYADFREQILGLRTGTGEESGIPSLIKESLERFKRQWGIETNFNSNLPDADSERFSVDPLVEVQLLRIFQESLSNIRRHSHADQVEVQLDKTEKNLIITVKDNGDGFNPQKIPRESLGLRIMHERAHAVGGKLDIKSLPGSGTTVLATFPMTGRLIDNAQHFNC